jgi:hypothetical protein
MVDLTILFYMVLCEHGKKNTDTGTHPRPFGGK